MREFADASREVDATDCAADGDPRELLQCQRARVEVAQESPQVVTFGLPLAVIATVIEYAASRVEMLIANGQVARVQFPTSEAECQQLICNANGALLFCEDQHPNQPELQIEITIRISNPVKIPMLSFEHVSVKECEFIAEQKPSISDNVARVVIAIIRLHPPAA